MDRELLIEIGTEELPASWLPSLTRQFGEHLAARLPALRLPPDAPVETFSTPRRLTARVARMPERQSDLEELVNGPAVSAAFKPDGEPTPAAIGFARKHGVEVSALERVETPKGTYLALPEAPARHAPRSTSCPTCWRACCATWRFPKQMHWDAWLEDGRGELLFGRPIRWILFLYGGRVVPFTIRRSEAAQSGAGAGGAVGGRHLRAPLPGDQRPRGARHQGRGRSTSTATKLVENFVLLERGERHDKIARELDAHAQRLGGRVSSAARRSRASCRKCPTWSSTRRSWPARSAPEFLDAARRSADDDDDSPSALLPGGERGRPADAGVPRRDQHAGGQRRARIARNCERVLTARLRDARFFFDADRRTPLEQRLPRLATRAVPQEARELSREGRRGWSGSPRWIAARRSGSPSAADAAATAGRLAKADLTTDMVRELTELQGTMGGIYAREEGLPEPVWRAIYHQYLPVGVEADAPPSRADLGAAAITWAAVSLADKVDTLVGAVRRRRTADRHARPVRPAAPGARPAEDPRGPAGADRRRRARSTSRTSRAQARQGLAALAEPGVTLARQTAQERDDLSTFLAERLRYVFQQRGFAYDEINAIAGARRGFVDVPLRRAAAPRGAAPGARRRPISRRWRWRSSA